MLREEGLSKIYDDFESGCVSANKYWSDQLQNQTTINRPQDKECQISVVVPVFGEDLHMILRQLRSIITQENIDPRQFELIYVVNNSPNVNPEVIVKNTEVLQLPIWKNRKNVQNNEDYHRDVRELLEELRQFNLFAIDKSSPGNEIVDCIVGKARNRGIAEASWRFFKNEVDGLILQTDADSYYPDPTFFTRVLCKFKENSDLVALCGGVRVYCDVERYTDEQKKKSRSEVPLWCNYIRWKSLKFLLQGKSFVFDDEFMSGPNMIAKSFPSAVIHGVPEERAEDVVFGERLQSYAQKHDLQYSFDGAKDLFQVFSLLRLSGGQSNNLGSNIKTTDFGLTYTYDGDGKIYFGEFPNYKTALVEPIPRLYEKFKRLALKNCGDKINTRISEIEEIVELNERYMMQQLSEYVED